MLIDFERKRMYRPMIYAAKTHIVPSTLSVLDIVGFVSSKLVLNGESVIKWIHFSATIVVLYPS